MSPVITGLKTNAVHRGDGALVPGHSYALSAVTSVLASARFFGWE